MSKKLLKGVFAAAFALALAAPAAAQPNAEAGPSDLPEAAAGVQFKTLNLNNLNFVAKYLCKDPTGTTTVIGVSIADLQAPGDAWAAIASVGTGPKVERQTNYSNPAAWAGGARSPVFGVGVFPVDHTVAGKTATVFGNAANDIPAGFPGAQASLRVTYNGGGPACVLKKVLLGSATP